MENLISEYRKLSEDTNEQCLIAEFMEWEMTPINKPYIGFRDKYGNGKDFIKTDWNILMEVIKKCLEICHNKMLDEWENAFSNDFMSCDAKVLYKDVVDFIKWNKQNQ